MVQDPRETQLEVTPTNRVAIFYENGGPDKISIKQLDNIRILQQLRDDVEAAMQWMCCPCSLCLAS